MKEYYVFLDNENKGPLPYEELIKLNISKDTLIWYDGLEEWQKASNIEDFKELFKKAPPPLPNNFVSEIKKNTPPAIPIIKNEEKEYIKKNTEPEQKKNYLIYIIAIVLIFLIGIAYFQHIKQQEKIEIQQNSENNYQEEQLRLQEQKIAEQQRILDEQERQRQIELERKRQVALEEKRRNLTAQLNTAYNNLKKANQDYYRASDFKLLRSSGQRQREISEAKNLVVYFQNEVYHLENQIKNLK